jgi:L-lactate dehydrogenase (cytochrome)/(S)-mandelate dehydrogenase
MGVERAINIDDLRRMAKRRLPRIAFDFIEGGLEDEVGIARNERAFREIRLVPRYLGDVGRRDLSATLFGRTHALPVGIAPTGLAAWFRHGGDLMLARAARAANVPFIMSGSATERIEELGRTAPEHGWYQLYVARDRTMSDDLVRRARDAGLSTLVLTADVPVNSKRERNLRNGFTRPLKLTWRTKLEALLHPAWMLEYVQHGFPRLANWANFAPEGLGNREIADFVAEITPVPALWEDVERLRKLWPGKLVVKGLMHPDDAVRCAELGVDGIMVSNHGGRQLDLAPSPIEVLPAIDAAVGKRLTLMLDSGVRRGSDVLIALCLGAKYVFVGRATLYGLAAGGEAGVSKALDILRDEIDRTMAHLGTATIAALSRELILEHMRTTVGRERAMA